MHLHRLQTEVAAWATENFGPDRPSYQRLLGAAEELGELCHAHLKSEQKIRGTVSEFKLKKIDAVADIIIYLADYCTRENIDLEAAVGQTWEQVRRRSWTQNPLTGAEKISEKN